MRLLLVGGILLGLSCLAGYVGLLPAPSVSVNWDIPNGGTHGLYVPGFRVKSGPELAFIYIGSSSRGASNLDGLPEMIEALKLKVRQQAGVHGRSFVAIGIAQDLSAERGIEHLEKNGLFDEMMAGHSWLNTGLLKYIWHDFPGQAATPQVIVVDRLVNRQTRSGGAIAYAIRDEVLVVRKVRADEIGRWFEQQALLPSLLAHALSIGEALK